MRCHKPLSFWMMTFMIVLPSCLRGVVDELTRRLSVHIKRPLHVLTQPCGQTRTDWSTNAEASAMVAGKDRKQGGKADQRKPTPPHATPPGKFRDPLLHPALTFASS